ncbi:hypothetical protein SAMN02745673_03865 [Marinactinospora thermotolerans DSM 45154]|uniref:Uncharacterized protein n=1 Tax=Marinactinospora thermotolerans DSM 45154 TaxID=1122192 RepID=A0A1T4SRX3_9ACTN|nr:hypothetical protein [Marinactinospora thermotolerans]SKA30979.1 hypothetical protein SAMN02745673_03865 [Marinactinospora thermotolerans DSM 45154]
MGLLANLLSRSRRQLRSAWWPCLQAAATAGVAWWIARDLLGHSQAFFAPISAIVCLSAGLGGAAGRPWTC